MVAMAIERRAPVDELKQALTSIELCSAATVNLLNDLLGIKIESCRLNVVSAPETTKPRVPLRSRPRAVRLDPKPKRAVNVADVDAPDGATKELSAPEKAVLATEVVNATLKVLTAAVKTPEKILPGLSKASEQGRRSRLSDRPMKRSFSDSKRPLQPRPLNRVSSSPAPSSVISTQRSSSSSSSSEAHPGLLALAQCARAGMSYLRLSEVSDTGRGKAPGPPLESAMSALIGKLVALGLDELAIREIRMLKTRLATKTRKAPAGQPKPNAVSGRRNGEKEEGNVAEDSLTSVLELDCTENDSRCLELVVTTQIHALKLICSTARTRSFGPALAALRLSSASSPINLITASTSAFPSGKVAQWLQNISQILLSMSSSKTLAREKERPAPKLAVAAEIMFEIRCLALRIRKLWWKYSGHAGDVAKEIVKPFLSYTQAYAQRAGSTESTYALVAREYRDLAGENAASEVGVEVSDRTGTQVRAGALKVLANIAREAGQFDEAVRWTQHSVALLVKDDRSSAIRCAYLARLAAFSLRSTRDKSCAGETLRFLQEAARGLDGSIRGSSIELDELLRDVSLLRREASSFLSRPESSSEQDQSVEPHFSADAVEVCKVLIFNCLRVFARCLGHDSRSSGEKDPDTVLRHQKRTNAFSDAVAGAIDGALYLVRKEIAADGLNWPTLDGVLRDCLVLAHSLDDLPKEQKRNTDGTSVRGSIASKVSNLFWAYHVHSERATGRGDHSNILLALQKSVDSAREASSAGTASTMLALKLEKLGSAYMARGSVASGRKALVDSLQAHIDDGVLRRVADASLRSSMKKALAQKGDVATLGKTLTLLTQSSLKEGSSETSGLEMFVRLAMDDADRTCLLEWQLCILTGSTGSIRGSPSYHSTVMSVSDELLQRATARDSPLQRIRILTLLLSLLADHSSMFPRKFHTRIRDASSALLALASLTNPDPLLTYQDHLCASLRLCLTLADDAPDAQKIKQSLMVWSRMLERHTCSESLDEGIDDIPLLLNQLSTVANFFVMKGNRRLAIATFNLILRVQDHQGSPDPNELVLNLSSLALQYLHFGYSGKAGLTLTKAQHFVQQALVSSESTMAWYYVYTEYLLILGNAEKSLESLEESQLLAQKDSGTQRKCEAPASLSKSIECSRLVAGACYISSRIASERGLWSHALSHAKRCVKLNYRAWAGLEARSGKKIPVSTDASDSEPEGLTGAMSAMAVSDSRFPVVMSTTHSSLNGAAFWSLVPSLVRGLIQLSQLYSRLSLFQEALYFAEQVQKVVEAVDARPLMAENMAVTGSLYIRGGQMAKGEELIDKAKQVNAGNEHSKEQVHMHCFQGQLHGVQGRPEQERIEYASAERAIDTLTQSTFVSGIDKLDDNAYGLEQKMKSASLHQAPPKRRAPAQSDKASHDTGSRARASKRTPAFKAVGSTSIECSELLGIRGEILRLRAAMEVLQRKHATASSLLAQAETCPMGTQAVIKHRIALADQLLRQSLDEMSSDAVFCVVEESTISFPSAASIRHKPQKLLGDLSPRALNNVTDKSPSKTHSRHIPKTKRSGQASFLDLLTKARDSLLDVLATAANQGSTSTIWQLSSALSNVTVFLAATACGRAMTSIRPVMPMIYAELARSSAMRRERIAIRAEKQSTSRDQLLAWPQVAAGEGSSSEGASASLDIASFQKRYMDIIPAQWSVVSIALSANKEELFISRLQPGQNPFILRLPLARHNSRDADEEIFDFKQVQAELAEIIESANFTAHDARDMTKKGAKSRWWAEREALDAQLRDLLLNVENIWLGGFRGVFCQSQPQPELLSRFQQSFQNILNRHLPSRLKASKKRKADRVNLAPHILGLFVGLGCPSEDDELDEPLMDLLYFVVDILQFHGEHNAYDEIDFDAIVIETRDAIRSYYEATPAQQQADGSSSHIILILDKNLHAFPWESLPCLQGLSVSRLPSLECLRERLLLQQDGAESGNHGLRVDRAKGTYILNPLGDLKATQETFEAPLKSLSNWNAVLRREPSESEFKDALERSDLFLYFGHGSGAQYIRARTIKKLERCAVALLMGCSSGVLTDAGEFEPYGTPKNYLHAGCPALVATLWDVTDKDIDRFSYSVLQSWGLFSSSSSASSSSLSKLKAQSSAPVPPQPPRTPGRSRSRRRDGSPNAAHQRPATSSSSSSSSSSPGSAPLAMSLTAAVAAARETCVLKYLNGAAPVVYGVPVYLS